MEKNKIEDKSNELAQNPFSQTFFHETDKKELI